MEYLNGNSVLTSINVDKIAALRKHLDDFDCHAITGMPENTNQPFGFNKTHKIARGRISKYETAIDEDKAEAYRYIIALENGITVEHGVMFSDFCAVVIKDRTTEKYYSSVFFTDFIKCPVHPKIMKIVKERNFTETAGQIMYDSGSASSAKNWMGDLGISRVDQMAHTVKYVLSLVDDVLKQDFVEACKVKEFNDITTFDDTQICAVNPTLMTRVADSIAVACKQMNRTFQDFSSGWGHEHQVSITKIVALERSSGYVGALISTKLNIPLVMLRQHEAPDKDDGFMSLSYSTKNGERFISMHESALSLSDYVIIVDDVLGSGARMRACIDLVKLTNARVMHAVAIKDIPELRDKHQSKLGEYRVTALLSD